MSPDLLHSPATDRNKQPILDVLCGILPPEGHILEIASGTGEHVVYFAEALPNLNWQPTDPDGASLATIRARVHAAGLTNVHDPIDLDVRNAPWPVELSDAVLCINMVHISPWAATEALFSNARSILSPSGVLYLYGPYRQSDQDTTASNEAFDASLRSRNSEWGIRSLEEVVHFADTQGFVLENTRDMPANNLSVVFRNTLNSN